MCPVPKENHANASGSRAELSISSTSEEEQLKALPQHQSLRPEVAHHMSSSLFRTAESVLVVNTAFHLFFLPVFEWLKLMG